MAHDEARVKFAEKGIGPMIEAAVLSALQKVHRHG